MLTCLGTLQDTGSSKEGRSAQERLQRLAEGCAIKGEQRALHTVRLQQGHQP